MMNVAVVVATQKGMLAQGHALPAWIRLLEEKMGNVKFVWKDGIASLNI